jgi:Rrf2 family protein
MQRLAHVGLVHSVRGPHGGFTLAKPCDQINLLEVYEAIDGELVDTLCLLDRPVCGGACILGDLLAHVNAVIRDQLSHTTLCGLARSFGTKQTERKRRAAATPAG